MKRIHLGILATLPLLASCDPLSVQDFQPLVSGRPIRSSRDRQRLDQALADTAREHGLVKARELPQSRRSSTEDPQDEMVAGYGRGWESGAKSISLQWLRDHQDGSDKVRILQTAFYRSRESKQMEAEIRQKLH